MADPKKNDLPADESARLTTAYTELCSSYHRIEEFRGKLLGFLPLATGGLFLLVEGGTKSLAAQSPGLSVAIGLFGFVVTVGLFVFEIYGIRKCARLIALGKELESRLGVPGQFTHRPLGLQGTTAFEGRCSLAQYIAEPIASGIIYPAVAAAWLYLSLRHPEFGSHLAVSLASLIFVAGFVASASYAIWLDRDVKAFSKALSGKVSDGTCG